MPDLVNRGKIVSSREIRPESPTPEEVLQQLNLILSSEFFAPHSTLKDLLRAIVEESLAGHTESLKEITLATDVLGRKNYDTQKDSTVRVLVNTIRRKLSEYDAKNAGQQLVRMEIPRGHYKAVFSYPRAQTSSEAFPASPLEAVPHRHTFLLPASTIAATLLVIWGISTWLRPSPSSAGIPERITFDTGYTSQPAVSRDGSVLVYSSDRGPKGNINIWVRESEKDPRQLTDSPASDFTPDVSPDGTQVIFRSWRKPAGIWTVPVHGGSPKLLALNAYSPRFSPDGRWIAFTSTDPEGVFIIPSSGGAPKRLDPGIQESECPVWSPDGNSVVFVAHDFKNNTNDLWAAHAFGPSNQQPRPLGIQSRLQAQKLPLIPSVEDCPQDSIGNRILFLTSQNATNFLFQVPFALNTAVGQIEQVPQTASANPHSVRVIRSRNSLVFGVELRQTNIWVTNLDGSMPPSQFTSDGSLSPGVKGTWPALSEDGNTLAFITNRRKKPEISLKDLPSGVERILNVNPAPFSPIVLNRDGSLVMFVREKDSASSVVLLNRAQNTDRVVTKACPVLHDWSQETNQLLCSKENNLFLVNTTDSSKTELLHFDRLPTHARFSPDSRWISLAVGNGEGDQKDGIVLPLNAPGKTIRICQGSYEVSLHWAPNGNGLYFWSDRDGFRCLYLQPLDPKTKLPIGDAVAILHRHSAQHYPWSGGTLAVAKNKLAMTLQDTLANIFKVDLPR